MQAIVCAMDEPDTPFSGAMKVLVWILLSFGCCGVPIKLTWGVHFQRS